jgi:serine/threonine protein kinase
MAENDDRMRSADLPTVSPSDVETVRSSGDMAAPTPVPIGAAFKAGEVVAGRYRIVAFLAKGGMGEVYEAEDLELHGHVALKTIRPEIAADEKATARFRREIQLARQVTHPNVCRVFDVSHHRTADADVIFVTMELLHGNTLSQVIRERRFTTERTLPVVEQMAEALHAAHQAGIVHRDFKPANVVITNDQAGRPKEAAADLDLLKWDATKLGFGTIAREATELRARVAL